MKNLRILMTTDAVGGVWTYTIELAAGLQRHGFHIDLAVLGPVPGPGHLAEAAQVENVRLHLLPGKLEWMQDPWKDIEITNKTLLRLERETQPDLIHLNAFAGAALPWKAPTLLVGHSCVFSWFLAVRGEHPGSEWRPYRQCVREALQSADLVTAPTAAMLQSLRRHYGGFRSNGPIWNGSGSGTAGPQRKQPLILTAGRLWDEAKNASTLDTACAGIRWEALAAGPVRSPEGAEIEFHHLKPLGFLAREDLDRLMGRAAIFAAPALYEPFGLGILEAGRAGCALVLGDIATLRELWRDAAVFVPPRDPQAIRAALEHLIADPQFRQTMATAAAARAQSYTAGRMTTKYLEIYRMLRLGHRQPDLPAKPTDSLFRTGAYAAGPIA